MTIPFEWSGDTGLATLFAAAFLSATVLPGNSEIVLVAVLKAFPERVAAAVALATLGNFLGGLTTFALGRMLPHQAPREGALAWVRRYGVAALLLSWVPIAGDALCAAAGYLRFPWIASAAALAAGKFLRYLVVVHAAAML
jgi:membrane protein YqaA with SNARE-associated domain